MKLTYVDVSKYKAKEKIKKLYLDCFPKKERFSFLILQDGSNKKSNLFAILDNDKLIGICYLVNCDDAYYLMYLGVESSLRDKGYGSQILNDLIKKYKTLFLSINYNNNIINNRRKKILFEKWVLRNK